MLISFLQAPNEPWFCGGGEEGKGGGGGEDGVEVDAGPNEEGGGESEEHEGRGGEGECELGGEVAEDVVVRFIARWGLAVRLEEKRSDVAPEVCVRGEVG